MQIITPNLISGCSNTCQSNALSSLWTDVSCHCKRPRPSNALLLLHNNTSANASMWFFDCSCALLPYLLIVVNNEYCVISELALNFWPDSQSAENKSTHYRLPQCQSTHPELILNHRFSLAFSEIFQFLIFNLFTAPCSCMVPHDIIFISCLRQLMSAQTLCAPPNIWYQHGPVCTWNCWLHMCKTI